MATSNKVGTQSAKGTKLVQPPVVPQTGAPVFGAKALQQLAAKGTKVAAAAAKGVAAAAAAPLVQTIAPVGVATRNAGQTATIAGFALVGVNGRKQPLASSVTAAIWAAALAHQMANNGAMPTQAHIKLALPTVNPTSCGLGLTQYKAYTGQTKGTPPMAPAALVAWGTPKAPAPVAATVTPA